MTHVVCPGCRLRFAPVAAAYREACPKCGRSPQPVVSAGRILGFRLYTSAGDLDGLPEALSAAMAVPVEVLGPDDSAGW